MWLLVWHRRCALQSGHCRHMAFTQRGKAYECARVFGEKFYAGSPVNLNLSGLTMTAVVDLFEARYRQREVIL